MYKIIIRYGESVEIPRIREIEKQSFGANIHPEEERQIWEDKKGRYYLAQDGTGKIVGYLIVLFENPDESILQPLLRREKGKYMHDTIHQIKKDDEAYFHLLGVDSGYRGKGIGKQILQFAFNDLKNQFNIFSAVIRVNNIPSMSLVLNTFGGQIVSFQEKNANPEFIGSSETNLNVVWTSQNPQIRFNKSDLYIGEKKYNENDYILIALKYGEEEELISKENRELIKKLKHLFKLGYKGIQVIKSNEIGSEGITHYLFVRA